MRYSLRHLALTIGALGLALALTRALWIRGYATRNEGHGIRHVLQKVYSPDNARCFVLTAQYDHVTTGTMLSVIVHHRVHSVSLFCTKYSAEATMPSRGVWERDFPQSEVSQTTTNELPVWGNTEWTGAVALPSARCMLLNNGNVAIVLFDGRVCSFLSCDVNTSSVTNVCDISAYQADLEAMFRTSFAPDDVFWSYGLISCSEFFGFEKARMALRPSRLHISDLFQEWTRLCAAKNEKSE